MAKGKSSSGKNYTSKGQHSNVSKSTLRLMRDGVSEGDRMINRQNAWLKGQNPWITIANPNPNETNKRFIRVKANTLWGSPKERAKSNFIIK